MLCSTFVPLLKELKHVVTTGETCRNRRRGSQCEKLLGSVMSTHERVFLSKTYCRLQDLENHNNSLHLASFLLVIKISACIFREFFCWEWEIVFLFSVYEELFDDMIVHTSIENL